MPNIPINNDPSEQFIVSQTVCVFSISECLYSTPATTYGCRAWHLCVVFCAFMETANNHAVGVHGKVISKPVLFALPVLLEQLLAQLPTSPGNSWGRHSTPRWISALISRSSTAWRTPWRVSSRYWCLFGCECTTRSFLRFAPCPSQWLSGAYMQHRALTGVCASPYSSVCSSVCSAGAGYQLDEQ